MATKNPSDGFYSISDNSPKVPMALFAENRRRLAAALRESGKTKSVVLLQGGEEQGLCVGDSADVMSVFQQEAFFHWVRYEEDEQKCDGGGPGGGSILSMGPGCSCISLKIFEPRA